MSNVVYLEHLPPKTESSFLYTSLQNTLAPIIKDIYTHSGGGDRAWLAFNTDEAAKKFTEEFHNWHFGPTGQKMRTSLTTEAAIPENATDRLSEFLHARDNQIQSCTVEITGLPKHHTIRNLNQLLEPLLEEFYMYAPIGDPYYDVEPEEVLDVMSPEPGVGLVQLSNLQQAINIVFRYAGTYWKNATLNAHCVPDVEMEYLLAKEASYRQKNVKLFVNGIKLGFSAMEVREMFKDYPVRNINIPPGGKTFCFVFLPQADAKSVLAQFGNGVRYQGRMVRVSIADKGKKKGGAGNVSAAPAAAPSSDSPATKDLKINNLPYGISESDVRTAFQGFTVHKIIIKQGFAFVGITADEVGRALQELSGIRVGDRSIYVKVAKRSS